MVSQSSSVGYTIMGKTADLTVVQKTTIDTLHKEGKTQKVIAKEAGCSQSSVSKHINREAKERKRCGRKKCTSNRDNRTLERIVKQNLFKNVGEIHKEWTAAGVSASRTTTHRRMQDMGFSCRIPCVKPLLNNRQRQKRLAWAKGLDCCWVVQSYVLWWKYILHFLWKSGSQNLEEERRGTESTLLEVQCKVSTVIDGLGCHVICWCWSTVFSEVQGQHSHIPGSFRALHASCCWPTLRRCRFHFPTELGTCTKDHGIPVLNWPANSPDLNPIENLWGIVKRKMRYARPNNAEELKATIRATWALITPEQCHRLIDSTATATPHCCSNSYFSCSYFSVGQDF